MFATEIFRHLQEVDCYPNSFIAYHILFTITVTGLQIEVTEEQSEVNNGSERLNGLATLCIEKKLLDDIDINPIILDFASRIVRRKYLR